MLTVFLLGFIAVLIVANFCVSLWTLYRFHMTDLVVKRIDEELPEVIKDRVCKELPDILMKRFDQDLPS